VVSSIVSAVDADISERIGRKLVGHYAEDLVTNAVLNRIWPGQIAPGT
jgi:hypothetical protein